VGQYDLSRFLLPQDFAAAVGVKQLITKIPTGKPRREWWVQTHRDPAYWFRVMTLELREERGTETYLVDSCLWSALASEPTASRRILVTSITRQNVLFLWPIRLAGDDGRIDDWSRTAMDAAIQAKTRWVRTYADMSLGGYRIEVAAEGLQEPKWPADLTPPEIIPIAFRDKVISQWDHLVLRQLRGEV
jgi:hypothetical protein